jgi:polyhydroxyalkanoate synthesis regulator phasin
MSNVINQIKTLLGIEVKLAQMSLDNGTVLEAEVFEAGQSVFIVNGEDRVALPIGEYKLEDGKILIVTEEGIIAEIKEAVVEEEEPAEVEVEQEMSEAPVAKKVIESVVKESHFSKEDVDALKAEIESLKTELASLKNVEVKEDVELSAEPLTHNPEAKSEVKINLYGQKRAKTTFDSVLNKIANLK